MTITKTTAKNMSYIIYSTQRGVILIVALVMLLVMTTLGVTTISGATLNERIAFNNRDQQIARLQAEAALLDAENRINAWSVDPVLEENEISNNAVGVAGYYSDFSLSTNPITSPLANIGGVANFLNSGNWNNANSFLATVNLASPIPGTAIANPPRYIIELWRCAAPGSNCNDISARYVFRIIAIGWGVNNNTYSVMQGIYVSKQPAGP